MLALVAYIGTIIAANWAIATFGLVPVGFGLVAPAGVYFAGLTFTFRDLAQDRLEWAWTVWAIVIGAVVSAAISDAHLALASAMAFLVSEMCDLAVYTPIRERHWLLAVVLSNTVGLAIDSALFLWLAFGSLDFLAGQVVGKAWMTLLAVGVLWLMRRRHAVSVAALG